ncbi:MAG: hypothetical protein WC370_01050 [Dehalococcoidales bacterium]|jgi:membrane-associated phospholipid phosphatase
MIDRLARLVSNILNPFLVSVVVLIMLSFRATSTTGDAIKWAVFTLLLSVLPVLVVAIYLLQRKKLDGLFSNPRQQRNNIYLMASIVGALGCGLLWYFDGPYLLSVTFTAGLDSIVVFMIINYFWKISLHTAFTAAAVAVIIMVYGAAVAWTSVLVVPVAWARIQLKQHSLPQVATGGLLSAAMVVGIFWACGVV